MAMTRQQLLAFRSETEDDVSAKTDHVEQRKEGLPAGKGVSIEGKPPKTSTIDRPWSLRWAKWV